MAWFVTQSLAVILATFALGVVIGWLWWGRVWRRVPLGESEAVRAVSARYEATIAERDARIVHLGNDHAAQPVPDPTGQKGGPSAADQPAGSATAPPTEVTGDPGAGADPGTITDQADQPQSPGTDRPTAEPDDLQRIEGVGPRIAAALAGSGLGSFREIADADEERLAAALREAGLTFAPSLVTWPRQAALLAAGDEEGLAAVKAELTAGRSRPRPAAAAGHSASGDTAPGAGPTAAGATEARSSTAQHTVEGSDAADGTAGSHPTEDAADDATGAGPRTEVPAADGAGEDSAGAAGTAGEPSRPAGGADEDEDDELERVEGIGPRIATALHRAGILTYRDLAEADAPTLQAALAASGLRFAPSLPTWSKQAALLADGDEAGFLALTRTLVPDREGGRPS